MIEANTIDENLEKYHCIQKCSYCDVITHECENVECRQPKRSVCSNSLCQAKLLIDYYSSQVKDLKETVKDIQNERKEDAAKLFDAARKIDHYRLMLMGPNAVKSLMDKGAIDGTTIKVYAAQNKPFWEVLANEENGPDYILEWMETHFVMYSMMKEIIQAKGLKVQIKRNLIEATEKKINAANALRDAKPTPKKSTPENTSKEAIAQLEAIGYNNREAKAIYGSMKTYNCTMAEAIARWVKMNS